MDFFDNPKKTEGGYIFLSHSHKDILRVRTIRNKLEDLGFDPLCFYLKCLNENSEIRELIKREIDAREWFFYLNSEESIKSKWVNFEREYIADKKHKKVITADLYDEKSVADAIYRITHNLRVYISYSHRDALLAKRITDKLRQKDYLVFFDSDSFNPEDKYLDSIANAIVAASQDGCVIALLSQESVRSEFVKAEIRHALYCGGNIIPVLIGDTRPEGSLELILSRYHMYHLSEEPTDAEIDKMIEGIGNNIINN